MGNTTTKLSKLPIKQLSTSFSPLTGKWVIRLENPSTITGIKWWFQSPYGEMGNTTLSLSTRSGSGPTGDFFKPRAFFAFFGDPGSKPKSDSVVFSLSYAIFSPFWNFQTYRVFDPEIGFLWANVLPLFIFSISFLTYLVNWSNSLEADRFSLYSRLLLTLYSLQQV